MKEEFEESVSVGNHLGPVTLQLCVEYFVRILQKN